MGVLASKITTDFVSSREQLATCSPNTSGSKVENICNKLCAYDLYAPPIGEC